MVGVGRRPSVGDRGPSSNITRRVWVQSAPGGYAPATINTGGGAVHHPVHVGTQVVTGTVEGVVRKVPARVRERVVERALVGDAETAAQRSLAVAKHVIGKTNARAEVLVAPCAQRRRRSKTAGSADTLQLRQRLLRRVGVATRISRRNVGIDHPLQQVASRTRNKGGRLIVLFVMTSVQVPAQAQLQGQAFRGLPVILEIDPHLQIPPVPVVL